MSQRTETEKAARIRAEMQLHRSLASAGTDTLQSPCLLCPGTVSMRVIVRGPRDGQVTQSEGRCSTPNCLEWTQ